MVVIIDGLFYASTPVWQRELLAGLDFGITVVGASSMGALRAAELAPCGMIGYGTVYRWYSEGKISGDDEVSLLHSSAEFGYKSLSEPLVNMRYNLERAYQRNLISSDQSMEMLDYLKQKYFGDRSYELLYKSPPFMSLDSDRQTCLREFLCKKEVDLKRDDAVKVLEYCARYKRATPTGPEKMAIHRRSARFYYEVLMRGAHLSTGELVTLSTVLKKVLDHQKTVMPIIERAARRFFLLQWIEERKVEPPDAFTGEFYDGWCARYLPSKEYELWFRANGLTRDEFKKEIKERASEAWVLDQGPHAFGLEFESRKSYVEALTTLKKSDGSLYKPVRKKISLRILANSFINDWAKRSGIECSGEVIDNFLRDWKQEQGISDLRGWLTNQSISEADFLSVMAEEALVDWMVKQRPAYFGHDTWFDDIVLLRELQVKGQVAPLARELAGGVAS